MQVQDIETHLAQRHYLFRRGRGFVIPKDQSHTFEITETELTLKEKHVHLHEKDDCGHSLEDLGGDLG